MKIRIRKEYLLSLVAVLLGLVAGAILMLAIGSDPLKGYLFLFQGGLMSIKRIGNTLATATPLILTGLSVAFAFRTGLFNIGAAGQMLMGGFAATGLALTLETLLPRPLVLLCTVGGGLLAGALWGVVPGLLKARFNVNEVVSTIMMNWIAFWTVNYGIPAYFRDPNQETQSQAISAVSSLKADWLLAIFPGSYVNIGLFLAVIAALIVAFLLDKTTLGYELKAVGFNRNAAEYAGIRVNRGVVLSMAIAGALSGLAGVTFYTGYAVNMQIGVLPSQGFDGIAVSLLGANAPAGAVVAALFFGILQSGKGFMNAMTDIPPDIADTIIATVIYFAATSVLMERVWASWKRRRAAKVPVVKKEGGN